MRILIAEDEKDMATALATGLSQQGFAVDIAYDGAEALQAAEVNSYDLLILDLNLPRVDGLEVCKTLRSWGATMGILILTARFSLEDRVKGLNLGADDYIVKPFHFAELMARIHAVLRRNGEKREVVLKTGNLQLDPNTSKVIINTQQLVLTVKEFGILEYLMRNIGRTVSQEELLEHVWNEESNAFTQAIKVHVNNLRKKLSTAGENALIITVKGKGYLIEPRQSNVIRDGQEKQS